MDNATRFSSATLLPLARLLAILLLALGLSTPARATAGPPAATGRPLAEALNPDGTLKAGAAGSFDARAFRMRTGPHGRPTFRPAGTAGVGDERWTDEFGLANGADSPVVAIAQSGTDIYIGGTFTSVGMVKANYVARWNGTSWSSLGSGPANGMNGSVHTMAVASNGDLYVGGYFTQAGGVVANRIARWNGTAWSSLGTGTTNGVSNPTSNNIYVYALAVASSGDLFVGGQFTQAGGTTANNVAKWNGTAWSSLGTGTANGVNTTVYALALATNNDLYVGGRFTQAGGIAVNRLARWNGAAWSNMNSGTANGLNEYVSALAVASNGYVYAAGRFTQFGGITANRIARWNGTAWSSLGTGAANGLNNDALALAVTSTGDIMVGGTFTQAGGASANRLARWNGTNWSPVGSGAANDINGNVYALTIARNGDMYVGGSFSEAGGLAANCIAKYNGAIWSSIGTSAVASNGVSGSLYALAVAGNGDIYAVGSFTEINGIAANNVARWNGTAWSSLGTGSANGLSGVLFYAVALGSNGNVYVGGAFTQAGGVPANNVARWDGSAWSSLGTGTANGVNSTVHALAVAANGDVYVGGYFTQAGGAGANNIARWNGAAWNTLGTGAANGTTDEVNALAIAGNGDVYVGGYFTQAGTVPVNNIAKWSGTVWSALGSGTTNGVDGYVTALAIANNTDVYVGGYFAQAGGVATNGVARWNGTTWNSIGGGTAVDAEVRALAVASNGDLYMGGDFTQVGGVTVNNLARWNGRAWNSLGTGVNRVVNSVVTGVGSKVFAGGLFTTTGDGGKLMAHFGIYDPNAPLATAAAIAAPAAQLYPNPAHDAATLRLPAAATRQPLTLTDALGRLVRQYPAPAGAEAVLDLRGLPAGVYVVRCGEFSQRLVVE